MFKAEWTEKALDELNKLETTIAGRIIKKIDELLLNPYSLNIKRLKGIDAFRLRVGDYRVLFEVNSNIILILKVGHRKHIYEN
jgi:mRNA interferase RelE/StbE